MFRKFLPILILIAGSSAGAYVDICELPQLNDEQCTKAINEAAENRNLEIKGRKKVPFVLKFEPVFTDKSLKLTWSKSYDYTFSNGCEWGELDNCGYEKGPNSTRQVIVSASNAANFCKSIDARLPTKEEYNSLIRQFNFTEFTEDDHTFNPVLTRKGISDMEDTFGLGRQYWYWTSTVSSKNPKYAAIFHSFYGYVIGMEARHNFKGSAIRCVKTAP